MRSLPNRPNRSIDTGDLSVSVAGLLSAGHINRYATDITPVNVF